MPDTRNIDLTFDIPAACEAVWAALTEGDQASRWFAPEVRVKPGKDGTIFVSWGPGMEVETKIREWKPNEHLRFEFGENPQTKTQLFVDYTLETKGGTTVLRLVQSGFSADAEWDEEFESHLRGWRLMLLNMRHDLVNHRGKACKQHVFCVDTEIDRADAWTRATGKNGLDRDGALTSKKTGDHVELVTAGGERLAGTVQVLGPARDLAMTLDDYGNALLRVSFERRGKGGTMIYGIVVAYGDDQGRAEATAGKLRETLQAALAG
jgi:uncharacterized protein YndB with AHSA1/START domain